MKLPELKAAIETEASETDSAVVQTEAVEAEAAGAAEIGTAVVQTEAAAEGAFEATIDAMAAKTQFLMLMKLTLLSKLV